MAERPAFDPGDPFDAVAQTFKNEIADIALRMMKVTIYRELPPHKQLEAFIVGSLTGVLGVAFAHAQPASSNRKQIMRYVKSVLPFCQQQAEEIVAAQSLSSDMREKP